jgi:hypothetical protein
VKVVIMQIKQSDRTAVAKGISYKILRLALLMKQNLNWFGPLGQFRVYRLLLFYLTILGTI